MSKSGRHALLKKIAALEAEEKRHSDESRNRQHECRSQLHTILGYARLIASHSRAITDEEIAQAIGEAGQRLLSMIEDGVMRLPSPADPPAVAPASRPAARAHAAAGAFPDHGAAAPATRRYAGRERTILIADDTQDNIVLLHTLFADLGFRVLVARSGHQAIGMLDAAVDLVITDQGMADGTGWDVLLASKNTLPERPVILLSGALPARPRCVPEHYFFADTLHKPADHRKILKSVGDALQLQWRDATVCASRRGSVAHPDADADAGGGRFAISLALRADLARLTGLGLVTDIGEWANALLLQTCSIPEMAFAEAVIFSADRLDFAALGRLSNA